MTDKKINPGARRRPGRPRAFDRDKALEQAMLLFWREGYDGTSIAQLTDAIGIAAPSLYAAFGSKRQLYREALQLYVRTLGQLGVGALKDAPSAREGVHAVLIAAAEAFTRPGLPPGCMVGVGSLHCSLDASDAVQAATELRRASYDALLGRLERARRDGELPDSAEPYQLADLYSAVVSGMSVLAHDGAARERLTALADRAMAAWPSRD